MKLFNLCFTAGDPSPSSLHQCLNLSWDWNGSEKKGRRERHRIRTLISAWQLPCCRLWLCMIMRKNIICRFVSVDHSCLCVFTSLALPCWLCVSRRAFLKVCPVKPWELLIILLLQLFFAISILISTIVACPCCTLFCPRPLSNPQQSCFTSWRMEDWHFLNV